MTTDQRPVVRVYHSYYGCETGCCGHTVEVPSVGEKFEFTHPWSSHTPEEARQWAIEFAQQVVMELWPECYPTIDWAATDTSEVHGGAYC